MSKATQRYSLSWGYARGSGGEAIIRNWYLICTFAAATALVLFWAYDGGSSQRSLGGAGLLYLCAIWGLWSLYLEARGVVVGFDRVTYPIRLGIDSGVLPLFQRTLLTSDIQQASTQRMPHGAYKVYLSGEFGQAKLVFDTKGGRDRLLTIMNTRFPQIRIFRWT
jgi:hypothetical protein